MSFSDDINRLFNELVHVPWSRSATALQGKRWRHETEFDFEIPIGGELGDISISLQGRELLVRARHRGSASGLATGSASNASVEHSFIVPDGAEVSAIEAQIKDSLLHVRVRLRTAR